MKRPVTLCATSLFAATLTMSAADTIDFGDDIYPIIRGSCIGCHSAPYEDTRGRIKTPKGGLRLDTPEWIQKGYMNDENEQEFVIVAGDAEASTFYTTTILPEDHDDIMPAKGDPLTKAQTDTIKAWIHQGADYGDFVAPEFIHPKSKAAAE